jgi:hypothetical protein
VTGERKKANEFEKNKVVIRMEEDMLREVAEIDRVCEVQKQGVIGDDEQKNQPTMKSMLPGDQSARA